MDGRHDGGGDAAVAAADGRQHAAAAEAADVEGDAEEQRGEQADRGSAYQADYPRAQHCCRLFTRAGGLGQPCRNNFTSLCTCSHVRLYLSRLRSLWLAI